MAEQGRAGGRLFWMAGGLLTVAALGALVWIWRSGGMPLPGAAPSAAVEECGDRLSAGSAIAPRLARDLAAEFLRTNGYAVGPPVPAEPGEVRIVGLRGALQCSIAIKTTTSSDAFADLASGTAAAALSMRPITDRDQAMLAAAGAGDFIRERPLAEHLIAYDAVAVVVHTDNPMTDITIGQVRDIGAGLVTSWEALNGATTPLTLYVPVDGTSPSDYPNDLTPVRHPLLETMHQRAKALPDEAAVLEALRADPVGVTALSAAFVPGVEGVRALPMRNGPSVQPPTPEAVRSGAYPMMRRFFAYVRPAAMRESVFVQRFVAFLGSDAARNVVTAAGFYPPGLRDGDRAQVAGDCMFGTLEAAAVAAATAGASRVGEPFRFVERGMELEPASLARLQELSATVAAQLEQGATAVLIGHADTSGEAESNRALALRRAIVAREAFESAGVFGVVTESAGEMCFNRENATVEGRRSNQRVELWIRPASTSG
jgi:phosphate transport system substrate-binding protein